MLRASPILLLVATLGCALGFRAGAPALQTGPSHVPLLTPARAAAAPRSPAVRLDFGGQFQRFKLDAEEGEVADVPFEIRFSLGNLISASGALLFLFCIGKFLLNNGESDVVSTFGFVYAIPALVGGLALKYAELPPVNLDTTPAAEAARASKATTIQATPCLSTLHNTPSLPSHAAASPSRGTHRACGCSTAGEDSLRRHPLHLWRCAHGGPAQVPQGQQPARPPSSPAKAGPRHSFTASHVASPASLSAPVRLRLPPRLPPRVSPPPCL